MAAAAIAAVPPTILGLLTLRKSNQNSAKIEEVHKSTNGKMDKLLEVTGAAEYAKGTKDEKNRQTEEKQNA